MTFTFWAPCFCNLPLCCPTSTAAADMSLNVPGGTNVDFYFMGSVLVHIGPLLTAAADMSLYVPEGTIDDFYFLGPVLVQFAPLLTVEYRHRRHVAERSRGYER
jgi:hypothetical protein